LSNGTSLTIGLSGTHDGVQSGAAALTLTSDGTGIDSLGTTALTAQTISATGTLFNYATASLGAPNPVSFGNRHVGDTLNRSLSITNLGTADGFTEALDGGIGSATGGAITSGSFSGLGAAKTGTLAIGLLSIHDGAQAGKATVSLVSDGAGIDNLGTTALAAQTISATATLYNYATASTVAEVDFGNHHVSDRLSQSLVVSNTGTADGFTENLDASSGDGLAGGSFRISGNIAGLSASKTDSSNLAVSLTSNQEGDQFGAATIFLRSDGGGVDGLGTTSLGTQNVLLTATLFSYAAPILSTTTLNFGATRVGISKTASLTIADGSAADPFQENLGYMIGAGVPAGYSVTGPVTGAVTSGGTAATATWGLLATKSSVLTTSFNSVALTSLGAGTSGLADTALAAASVALVSKVYSPAVAQLSVTSLNFGVVHVGDTVTSGETITNAAAGALTDVLTGGIGTIAGGGFTVSGSLGTGLVSGASKRIGFGLNTGTSGVFSTSATLALASHDADLADLAVAAGPIALSGTVDNYATAAIQPFHGTGAFTGSGTHYTLNLGTVAVGAIAPVETLDVANTAGGLADLLSGSFVVSGSGFINNGMTAFSGLGAGHGSTAPTIALSAAKAGVFTETVTLLASGSNGSGYLGVLPAETLTVTGTVTPQARTLAWTGATDTNLGNALNWNDTTAGRNPSASAPGVTDDATFDGTGGGITGQGTVAGLSFGSGDWHLASAATLIADGGVTVGLTQAGGLLIDRGSDLQASSAVIAAAPGSDGSSISVTGAGSSFTVAGALLVGNQAAGVLSINAGATVTAASLDAGVLASDTAEATGQISLSGTNTVLDITGDATVGDQGSANLSVINGATFAAANLTIGAQGPGSGAVFLSDAGSVLDIAGTLSIGTPIGVGELTIGPNATVIAAKVILQGEVVNEGGLLDPNEIDITPGNPLVGNGGAGGAGDIIVNDGSIEAKAGKLTKTETVTGSIVGSFGTLSGTGNLVIDAGSTLSLQGAPVDASQTVLFGASSGALVVGDIGGFQATIGQIGAGDTIIVQTAGAATFSTDGSVVSVIQNGVTLGAVTFASAALASAGALVDHSLCFLPDTLIATPGGEVKVQALRAGDVVCTARGVDRPIVWIGQGRVLAPRGRRSAATPVIVRRGALGPNVPHYDLHVTKGHALFIDDVLIPVEFLVNHRSILWDDQAREVVLYHVELDVHDVLLANGAPAESYRDDGNRWLFQNGNSGWDHAAKPPCAPVLTGGAVVDAVWQRLLERSGPRPGLPLTDDADVHLVVDGVRLDGARSGDRCVFRLGGVPASVRLVSRAASRRSLAWRATRACWGWRCAGSNCGRGRGSACSTPATNGWWMGSMGSRPTAGSAGRRGMRGCRGQSSPARWRWWWCWAARPGTPHGGTNSASFNPWPKRTMHSSAMRQCCIG
jgi:T5SS/PEP-CTERM-associated repeat protein